MSLFNKITKLLQKKCQYCNSYLIPGIVNPQYYFCSNPECNESEEKIIAMRKKEFDESLKKLNKDNNKNNDDDVLEGLNMGNE